jgi:hypothetical protein
MDIHRLPTSLALQSHHVLDSCALDLRIIHSGRDQIRGQLLLGRPEAAEGCLERHQPAVHLRRLRAAGPAGPGHDRHAQPAGPGTVVHARTAS